MYELSRRVRFCINPGRPPEEEAAAPRHNTFAGWPSMAGLGTYYELDVVCCGQPDPVTGYLMNITTIDRAVREHALPLIDRAVRTAPEREPAGLLPELITALQPALDGQVASLTWHLTPYHALTMQADQTREVLLRQQFEFAAAHRLHCPSLSDAENREVFGKCNNATGHGHNYRLEVAVSAPLDGEVPAITLRRLEQIVDERIIQRFDHTNLNADRPEFENLNPSVEHIARVCYDLLTDPLNAGGARLAHVTVWETGKTSCTYHGP